MIRRVLRFVLLGPVLVVVFPLILFHAWLVDAPYREDYPRWLWQLLWYGEKKAKNML